MNVSLDDTAGYFYTDYEVRLISDTVEVWVQTDLRYWFMLYLAGRLDIAGIDDKNFGFIKDVARVTTDPTNGAEAINNMLERVGAPFRWPTTTDQL